MKIRWRKVLLIVSLLIIVVNGAAFFQTWHITHFCKPDGRHFVPPDKMSLSAKVTTVFTGMYNPKSSNDSLPRWPFQKVNLASTNGCNIEAWDIPAEANKGTVVILHGFKGSKASMLPVANYFHQQGMNCFMIDFAGHGNSDGYTSSVGYYESKDVQVAYEYTKAHHTGSVILFGSSMGAVSAMHAVAQYGIQPDKMILEAPFGSMLQASNNRFDMQGIPAFPVSPLMVFWGGVQGGFWAFSHKPTEYAKSITMPVLLMYGVNDKKVSLPETEAIFANLKGEKTLHLFQHSAHTNFLELESAEWESTIDNFMAGPVYVNASR